MNRGPKLSLAPHRILPRTDLRLNIFCLYVFKAFYQLLLKHLSPIKTNSDDLYYHPHFSPTIIVMDCIIIIMTTNQNDPFPVRLTQTMLGSMAGQASWSQTRGNQNSHHHINHHYHQYVPHHHQNDRLSWCIYRWGEPVSSDSDYDTIYSARYCWTSPDIDMMCSRDNDDHDDGYSAGFQIS